MASRERYGSDQVLDNIKVYRHGEYGHRGAFAELGGLCVEYAGVIDKG